MHPIVPQSPNTCPEIPDWRTGQETRPKAIDTLNLAGSKVSIKAISPVCNGAMCSSRLTRARWHAMIMGCSISVTQAHPVTSG